MGIANRISKLEKRIGRDRNGLPLSFRPEDVLAEYYAVRRAVLGNDLERLKTLPGDMVELYFKHERRKEQEDALRDPNALNALIRQLLTKPDFL